tara:strand:- start:1634 stop:2311 length:678 start_codon:yes stop_codon:yes gene_type:complete
MIRDTLCIVPARSGSKGIKNKNIIRFKKKPLFIHSLEFSKKFNFIKKTILSTDSKKYLNIARKHGYNFDNLRPKKLASDLSKTIDVIKYEIRNLDKSILKDIKYILILQPTCPFRKIKDFQLAYLKLKKNYDSVITIKKTKEQPERMMKMRKNGDILNYNDKVNFLPRQKLEQLYLRAGSMYFFKAKQLENKNFNLGKKIFGIEVKKKYAINIDNLEDLKNAKIY